MNSMSLQSTQWLTLREISELWAPELNIPASTILRELRFAMYKLEQSYPYNQPLTELPPEDQLPSPDALVDRSFIERFNDKQIWKLPGFWFENLPTGPSYPGRPSQMDAIVQELEERFRRRQMLDTLAAESRALEKWAREKYPGVQTPKATSIGNGTRVAYNTLKREQK